MRNRKIQRELKKTDKILDKSGKLGYSKPKELNDFNPCKIVPGSFEGNTR